MRVSDVTASPLADALRDRYTIERELGRGGMATVYLAQAPGVNIVRRSLRALGAAASTR